MNRVIPLFLGASLFGISSLGIAAIDLYEQDFENPSSTVCPDFEGNSYIGRARSSYSTPDVPFYQRNSADRLCPGETGSPDLVDPAPESIAGNYAIGFHGGRNYNPQAISGIESIGFIFDPQSYRFLNGQFIASLMGVPGLGTDDFTYEPGVDLNFTIDFYEIPPGTVDTSVVINAPTAHQGSAVITISGGAQTPFESLTRSVSNSNPVEERFTLDWNDYSFSIDLDPMNDASSRVMMVITGMSPRRYLALDNFYIYATQNELTLPTSIVIVPPGTTGNFNALDGASNLLGLLLSLQPTFSSSHPAAGTLSADTGTGEISFTPQRGFSGDVLVTFEVCDSQAVAVCATQTITFRVPAAAATTTEAIPVNQPWALALMSAAIGLLAATYRRCQVAHQDR